jgi:GNAT superfamily N-acetyltransferase
MRINEIYRMSQQEFPGGKQALAGQEKDIKGLKPLPGNNRFQYNIINVQQDPTIQIWDQKGTDAEFGDPQMVGALLLNSVEDTFPLKGAVRVQAITVDEDYRGQGIAKELYEIALKVMKRPVVSGFDQTAGGRRNWISLTQMPGVRVHGYLEIEDELIGDGEIDDLMGKLGAQYLGDTKNWGRLYRVFTFDVQSAKSGQELEAAIENRLSQLYDHDSEFIVGLYAVWGGK